MKAILVSAGIVTSRGAKGLWSAVLEALMERVDEKRSDPGRTALDLSGTGEGTDLAGDPLRRHGVRLGLSAIRSRNRPNRRGLDRASDRAGAGTDEALPRGRRLVDG